MIFIAVYFVGWRLHFFSINHYFGMKVFLFPTTLVKSPVNRFRDRRFAPPRFLDITLSQTKVCQYFNNILPLVWEIILEYGNSMLPFMHFIKRAYELR